MKMLEVFITPVAEKQFYQICEYITSKWSLSSKEDFVKRFHEKTNQISHYPYSCPESEIVNSVRKAVIDPKSSFFYLIKTDRIDIISVFDNSQSESTVKKSIG